MYKEIKEHLQRFVSVSIKLEALFSVKRSLNSLKK